jgi:LysM repeat protein
MTIKGTIDSYRKRRTQGLPLILGAGAVLLVVIGIIILVTSMSSGGGFTLFATKTYTPTTSFTPTDTATITETPTITSTPTITPTPTASAPYQYIVKEGETLTSIVELQGLGENAIINIIILNPGINPDLIKPGDVLILPAPNSPLLTPTPIPTGLARGARISHLVLPGESLGFIANKYLSTVDAIVNANRTLLKNGVNSTIYPGWLLVVPVNLVTPVPSITPTRTPTPSSTP